jgi:hypothetical protein
VLFALPDDCVPIGARRKRSDPPGNLLGHFNTSHSQNSFQISWDIISSIIFLSFK